MKNIIIALLVCFASILTATAQRTTTRWGITSNSDNTYRQLTLGLYALTDVAGATPDTLTIIPGSNSMGNIYDNLVTISVVDSCVLAIKKVTASYKGDKMTVVINNASGANHWVNFLGYSVLANKWEMASTGTKISLASGKGAVVTFVFNGVFWYETSRSVH